MAASTASVAEPPPFKHFMAAWAALGFVSTNEFKRPFFNDWERSGGALLCTQSEVDILVLDAVVASPGVNEDGH